jgi:hypothetical protein
MGHLWVVFSLSAALSFLLPVSIIAVRQTVKRQRQGVIRDLEKVFEGKAEQIIPSFEFVKFKYFVDHSIQGPSHKDTPIPILFLSSIPLVLILFCLGAFAFNFLIALVLRLPYSPFWSDVLLKLEDIQLTWLFVLVVAYLGSYLFVIRELLRSVSNFDLGPTTLLSAAIHVLFGAITAVVIATVADQIFPNNTAATVLIVSAFVVGFVPELGLRTLLRSTQLWMFKREDPGLLKAFVATPVEIIDGVDSEVRGHLSHFNITSVQNLATANPIMLFVETPYGVYQIIDWVAQAQLCAALGPRIVTELWKIGIRTIFDLEMAVLGNSTAGLRHEIGRVIVSGRNEKEQSQLGLGPGSVPSKDTDRIVIALVEMLIDDLHIHRLRQIWNRISERLGPENRRLTPQSCLCLAQFGTASTVS